MYIVAESVHYTSVCMCFIGFILGWGECIRVQDTHVSGEGSGLSIVSPCRAGQSRWWYSTTSRWPRDVHVHASPCKVEEYCSNT